MSFRKWVVAGLAVGGVLGGGLVAGSPAYAAPDATLCLYRLKVIDTEDWSGGDEVFLKRGSSTIWGPFNLNNGVSRDVKIDVTNPSTISAWDQDGGGTDAHDWIGTNTINRTGTYTYEGDGAHYELTVRSSC